MQERAYAALYHGVEWKSSKDSVIVSDGVTIGNLNASHINKVYEEACEKYRVDEGEPFGYHLYALFTNKGDDDAYFDFGSSYSIINQFSNALAMIFKQPIGMCRLIWSDDNFITIVGTEIIYYSSNDLFHLFWDDEVSISKKGD